jgi:hypothetical protein
MECRGESTFVEFLREMPCSRTISVFIGKMDGFAASVSSFCSYISFFCRNPLIVCHGWQRIFSPDDRRGPLKCVDAQFLHCGASGKVQIRTLRGAQAPTPIRPAK